MLTDQTGKFYLIPIEEFLEAKEAFENLQQILNEPIKTEVISQ